MWVFRFLFTEAARLLRSAEGRRLLGLAFRYGSKPRNKTVDVSFGRYRFRVPDALSFVWQFREIFVDEFYRFNTTIANPVIFDCGTNIGTSVAYFRQTYPNARIIAFEADEQISATLQENLRQNQISGVEVVPKPSGPTMRASGSAATKQTRRLFSRRQIVSWCRRFGCGTISCAKPGSTCSRWTSKAPKQPF